MCEQALIPGIRFRFASAHNGAEELTLGSGCVLRNGTPRPAYRLGNAIYWEDGAEKGCLWLYYHGLAAQGFIEENGSRQELSLQSSDVEYQFSYVNEKKTTCTFLLSLGTRKSAAGGFLKYGKLTMNGIDIIESFACDDQGTIKPGQTDNGFLRTSLTSDGALAIELDLSSRWILGINAVHELMGENFNLWSASLVMSRDFQNISGTAFEQKTVKNIIQQGNAFSANGFWQHNTSPTKALALSSEQVETLRASLLALGDGPKSLTELYTLPAPNMSDVNKLAAETLYYLAVYYVADRVFSCQGTDITWSEWFGLDKDKAKDHVTDISEDLINLVSGDSARQEAQDFLVKYAEACLSDSYTGSTDATLTQALSGAKSRLKNQYSYCTLPDLCSYYLQGNGKTSMAQDPGYHLLLDEINRYTYMKSTPGLRKYVDESASEWAKKLYDQCIATTQQLRLSALTGDTGSTEVSHKSMMLSVLDNQTHEIDDGSTKVSLTYGAALYAKVLDLQLSELADSLGVEYTSSQGPGFTAMMEKIYGIVWDELQKKTSDSFAPDILQQFQQLQKEYAQLTKEAFIQDCLQMTEESMELISNGSTLVSLIPKLSSLSQKPWAAYTAGVCSIVFYATSLASLSTVFLDWSDATPEEKAEAILTCVQGVANIGTSVAKMVNIRTLLNPNATFDERVNAALRLRFGGDDMSTISGLAKANGQELDITIDEMASRYSINVTSSSGEAIQVSKVTKFFRIAEMAVRCLNVLIMGFVVVTSAVAISKEAKEGGYTISVDLEIVSTCLMSISFICEAVSFGMEAVIGITCSVLPVVGAAVAFVGIIVQIVASALKKPINPLGAFIEQVIVPFLNTLEIPSQDWIKDHSQTTACALA